MMGQDGEIKLIDFGLAKKFHNFQGEDIGKMIGTPLYLAPEAINGHSSIEADLWSLGVLMFVLLSGSYPYHGNDVSELYEDMIQN